MAENQRSGNGGQSGEAELSSRLALAVQTIAQNADLRLFVRDFLSYCHTLFPSDLYDRDPIQTAYNQGVHAAGVEFARRLASVPGLWPTLLLEEERENAERLANDE